MHTCTCAKAHRVPAHTKTHTHTLLMSMSVISPPSRMPQSRHGERIYFPAAPQWTVKNSDENHPESVFQTPKVRGIEKMELTHTNSTQLVEPLIHDTNNHSLPVYYEAKCM